MSKHLLQIDASKSKDNNDNDLINIRFNNSEVIQANFPKLFIQSKYLRDKYIYWEGLNSIQNELDDLENKMNISIESIKCFIELVENEKVEIPIERYKDVYTLCEYFCIPKLTHALDKISRDELFHDVNFTIQILIDLERRNNSIESKLKVEIENFLRERVNEIIQNPKFGELPVSTIYRIFKSRKEGLDQNLLIDFIFESISTRFILFKFVEVDKLIEDKLYEMICKLESEEENMQEIYLEYIPFNVSLIKTMKNKYESLKKENSELKAKLSIKDKEESVMKDEIKSRKEELKRREIEEEQIKEELKSAKEKLKQREKEESVMKEEIKSIKDKLEGRKIEEERMRKELSECQREQKQTKNELTLTKSENNEITQSIIVGGYDNDSRLGEKPNNKNKIGFLIISPPVNLSLDPSLLLSYSVYCHTILVMSDGSLKGAGYNFDGRISATLPKTNIDHFTDFCIKDGSGRQLAAVSAVCSGYGTLYMISKIDGSGRQLVLCDCSINGGNPVFLDIGNHHPVSLFGGRYHSASIGDEGEVIFINRNSVQKSPKSRIASVSLPDGEKASSVACCDSSVVVLSSNGRIFTSPIESNGVLHFSIFSELSSHEIVCVSGISEHILAVSKEGRVFGLGSNKYGKLCLGEGTKSVSSFTEIGSLLGYEIRAAYAGLNHSLFETREGKIISCGYSYGGELLLRSGAGYDVYSPTETTITSGASFCIAGAATSTVFIGKNPPLNTPNQRIQRH